MMTTTRDFRRIQPHLLHNVEFQVQMFKMFSLACSIYKCLYLKKINIK